MSASGQSGARTVRDGALSTARMRLREVIRRLVLVMVLVLTARWGEQLFDPITDSQEDADGGDLA